MTPLALPEKYPDHPERVILVVPHAGGGAAVANSLRQAAPAGWLVAGVMFGGRESRFLDDPPAGLDDLVTDTVRAAVEVADLAAVPPLLVGQCSGALVAWLAAARLAGRGDATAGLVVVSRSAPSWPGEIPDATADDAQFLRQVIDMGGVPPEVADMPDLLDLLLPSLRADFAALAEWPSLAAAPIVPLRGPALVLSAPGDPCCPDDALLAWCGHLTEPAFFHVDGRHFLLGENPVAVARLIRELIPTPKNSRRSDNAGTF